MPALPALMKTLSPYLLWADFREGLRPLIQAPRIALNSDSSSGSGTNMKGFLSVLVTVP